MTSSSATTYYQVDGGFAVQPKTDCPHIVSKEYFCLPHDMKELLLLCSGITKEECGHASCSESEENWLCLTCGRVFCSRYKHGHMAEHCNQEGDGEENAHCLAFSLADLSTWCYRCDSYIESDESLLKDLHSVVYREKFGELPEVTRFTEEEFDLLYKDLEDDSSLDNEVNYRSRLKVIADYINDGKAKKIVVLTGAGLSTSAGIPDFRSPKTGLYENLQKYNLPYPTAIFELNYFKTNPKPFFELAKDFISSGYNPTISHYFIKLLNDKGLLLRNYTQNIDGLELKTGIDKKVTIQAHGCYDTAHCIDCEKEYTLSHVKSILCGEELEIPYCSECEGVIKPDIVLFGESLPDRYCRNVSSDMKKADLLIVMGTSLTVYPVAGIVSMIKEKYPRLLLNRERVGPFVSPSTNGRASDYFVGQPLSIDDAVKVLAEELGWIDELNELVSKGPVEIE